MLSSISAEQLLTWMAFYQLEHKASNPDAKGNDVELTPAQFLAALGG